MAVDPIFCVQDAWQDGKLVLSEDDKEYHFRSGVSLPKNFKTVLKDHEGTGDYIDVRTLVLVLRHKDLPHGQFRAESKGSNISYPDRRDLEAFLAGRKDTTKCLPAGVDIAFPPAKRLRTEDGSIAAAEESSALAEILGRERRLRDRNTQLLVPGKSFKRALDLLEHAQKRLNEKERAAAKGDSRKQSHSAHKGSSSSATAPSKRREENGHAGAPPPPPPGAPSSSAAKPPRPSSQHHASSSASASRPPHSSSRHGSSSQKGRDKKDVRGMMPIIIVPAAATANINMANAKDFLENGVYRQPSEDGAPKQTAEKFMRKMGRKEPGVPYLVTSKAPDKRSEEWRRVVAVFVTGQTWQFKGWPHEHIDQGNMAHALSKMLGVYVGLKGELVPENVKQWNVLKLEVPKNDRHKDRPLVAEIYAALDKFLASHHCELAY